LTATRDKEVGGLATDGVVNLFNANGVPRQIPLEEQMGTVSPVSLMPAFFEYWHFRTGDAFWGLAAESSRELLLGIPHSETGLSPDVITETGEVVESPAMYREESYPTAFHLALDAAWFNHVRGTPTEYVGQVNRLLGFFNRQTPGYVAWYEIDGTVVEDKASGALVALNGAAAAIATLPSRDAFLQRAWETTAPSGRYRFYDGVYQLLSLMFLGGDLKVKF
jgi:oligosaccharide reducing-end xylanase